MRAFTPVYAGYASVTHHQWIKQTQLVGYGVKAPTAPIPTADPKIKNPTRFPGRAQILSVNFTNSLIWADASSANRMTIHMSLSGLAQERPIRPRSGLCQWTLVPGGA
jgi:hypothetical protein